MLKFWIGEGSRIPPDPSFTVYLSVRPYFIHPEPSQDSRNQPVLVKQMKIGYLNKDCIKTLSVWDVKYVWDGEENRSWDVKQQRNVS